MFLGLKQDIDVDQIVPLAQHFNKLNLVNNAGQIYLLSNVCPHQKSRIATGATNKLQCPYHGLTFDIRGCGVGNSHTLEQHLCFDNQTMLFDCLVEYQFPVDTQYMQLVEHRQDIVQSTADIVMDVFLDIDHIPVAHPGVYDQIGISNINQLSWKLFNQGSIQFVPVQNADHIINEDLKYNFGAFWMAVYPGTMVEWQPGALFVTVAVDTKQGCQVEVYKYKDQRYTDNSYFTNSKVWELAWAQDRQLAELITELSQDNLDELKQHHRKWLKNVD